MPPLFVISVLGTGQVYSLDLPPTLLCQPRAKGITGKYLCDSKV